MTKNDQRKIRKIIMVLKNFRDQYANEGDMVTSSKFTSAAATLLGILKEESQDDDNRRDQEGE